MIADGGIAVHGSGLQITGTRAAYDLRANRLTVTGGVSVRTPNGTQSGKAYVYDFKTANGSFVPTATVAQLSTAEAMAIGQQVSLRPAVSITFTNAQVLSGGVLTPIASFDYAIPPPNAKDFGYSPVPSAALEWPVILGVGRNAYAFSRLRYDRYTGGPGAGLEEHYARTNRGYAVLGETLDMDGARYDLAAFQRLNGSLTQTLAGSRLFGASTLRYALSATGRYGYASLSFAQYNATRSDDLYATTNAYPVRRAGQFRLQIDIGHDVHPLDYSGAQDFRVTPGVHVDSATLHLGPASFSASADAGESLYDYGRATLATDLNLWSTLPVDAHLQLNAGTGFSHDAPPFPSTLRTYTAGMTWRASGAFNLVSSLAYAHDYGQLFGIGRPSFSAAFDVRIRRKNGTGVEIGSIVPFGGVGNRYRATVFNLRFFK